MDNRIELTPQQIAQLQSWLAEFDLDDPFWTFLGVDYSDFSEDDDDYDDYDDQQRHDDDVADDLFWTYLGYDQQSYYDNLVDFSEDAE